MVFHLIINPIVTEEVIMRIQQLRFFFIGWEFFIDFGNSNYLKFNLINLSIFTLPIVGQLML